MTRPVRVRDNIAQIQELQVAADLLDESGFDGPASLLRFAARGYEKAESETKYRHWVSLDEADTARDVVGHVVDQAPYRSEHLTRLTIEVEHNDSQPFEWMRQFFDN